MIRAVIFDIDDTVYPYGICDEAGTDAMRKAYSRIIKADVDAQTFTGLLSDAKKAVKSRTAGTAACHNRMLYAQKLCENVGCFTAANALMLYDAYWDAFLDEMRLYDGVLPLIGYLREKGIKIGFCTDLTAHIQMRKLIKLGLSDAADAVVTSEESGAEKPSSVPYNMILEKLGVRPEEAVMIGDDYDKDIAGALAAGMRAVQFGINCRHDVCAADHTVLAKILKEWIG